MLPKKRAMVDRSDDFPNNPCRSRRRSRSPRLGALEGLVRFLTLAPPTGGYFLLMKCAAIAMGSETRIITADAVTAASSPPGTAPLKSAKIVTDAGLTP
jgi:hypothetical protein